MELALLSACLSWLLAFVPALMSKWRQSLSSTKRWAWRGMLAASVLLTVGMIVLAGREVYQREADRAALERERQTAGERQQQVVAVRRQIATFLTASDSLRDEMYPLCRVPDYKRWEEKVEKQWREPVVRYLDLRLRSEAKDEFQRVTYQYEHRECGEIEWIKKWLAELVHNLRRVSDRAERYIR